MKIQNSYIFLSNPYKEATKKENSIADGKIVFEIGKNVYSYILTSFPNLSKEECGNFFRRVCSVSIQTETNCCQVNFIINEVADITYLDIIVEGKTEVQIIKCAELVQEKLLSSGIRDNYIDIVSYDSISEYYCNKILPKLNTLERNLRKLLFNIYIVNFGREYYQATISPDLQDKIKGRIKAKGNEEKKEIERLQQFFYSFEFNDIQKLLFTPSWTGIDEQEKCSFLDQHLDLSQLSDEELRDALSRFTPKSDWDRFFSSKIDFPDIEDMIEKIRLHRNAIAHFKFFYREDYLESNQLIKRLNTSVLKAIKLTEDKDFVEKNAEYFRKAMSEVSRTFEEFRKNISQVMTETIAPALQTFKTVVPSVMDRIKDTYRAFDFSGIKQVVLESHDMFRNSSYVSPEDFAKSNARIDDINECISGGNQQDKHSTQELVDSQDETYSEEEDNEDTEDEHNI